MFYEAYLRESALAGRGHSGSGVRRWTDEAPQLLVFAVVLWMG
jgi:hypothetical protein